MEDVQYGLRKILYGTCKLSAEHSITCSNEKAIAESIWCSLLIGLCFVASLPVFGTEIPSWIQPSFVGLLWGGQFMMGFWLGGANLLRIHSILIVCIGVCWLTISLQTITDFSFRESLLFNVIIFLAGWLVIRLDCRSACKHWPEHRQRLRFQMPLVDYFILMTVAACLVSSLGQLCSPPVLLIGVGCTVLVGCCSCWAAYHWAWNDQRPLGAPLLIALLMTGICFYWLRLLAPSLSMSELSEWLLCGPASVLASQTFTVLVTMAVVRKFSMNVPGISAQL